MTYDIIIPTAKRDISFLPKVVKYIRINLKDADRVYVITSKTNFKRLEKLQKTYANVLAIDEDRVAQGLSFESVKSCIQNRVGYSVRVGWYFQQFLKIGFALSEYCRGYYLSWDADTIPLAPISFFVDNKPLFTQKFEYNKPYFDTMHRLTGLQKTTDFSFIAEHMMFRKDLMLELVDVINASRVEGDIWFQKCLNAVDDVVSPSFSEFETYGTFVWTNHPGLYGTQRLNTFRSAGLIKGRWIDDKTLKALSIDLDTASFEYFSEPTFPYNLPHIYYRYERRWNKLLSLKFVDIIPSFIEWVRKKIKKEDVYNFDVRHTGGGKKHLVTSYCTAA